MIGITQTIKDWSLFETAIFFHCWAHSLLVKAVTCIAVQWSKSCGSCLIQNTEKKLRSKGLCPKPLILEEWQTFCTFSMQRCNPKTRMNLHHLGCNKHDDMALWKSWLDDLCMNWSQRLPLPGFQNYQFPRFLVTLLIYFIFVLKNVEKVGQHLISTYSYAKIQD